MLHRLSRMFVLLALLLALGLTAGCGRVVVEDGQFDIELI